MTYLQRAQQQVLADTEKFTAAFDLEVYGKLPGVNYPYEVASKAKVDLKYEIYIVWAKWGIDSLSVIVPEQEIEFEVDKLGADGESMGVERIKFKVLKPKVVLDLPTGDNPLLYLAVLPTTLEIHDGKAEVRFQV